MRDFVGLSQEQLARAASVSQGAVSRLEAARGLATPLLVAVKVQTALVAALREVDPAILSDDLRAVLEAEDVVSFRVKGSASRASTLTSDPSLDELIRLYRRAPERDREPLLAVFRATAAALSRQVDVSRTRARE